MRIEWQAAGSDLGSTNSRPLSATYYHNHLDVIQEDKREGRWFGLFNGHPVTPPCERQLVAMSELVRKVRDMFSDWEGDLVWYGDTGCSSQGDYVYVIQTRTGWSGWYNHSSVAHSYASEDHCKEELEKYHIEQKSRYGR